MGRQPSAALTTAWSQDRARVPSARALARPCARGASTWAAQFAFAENHAASSAPRWSARGASQRSRGHFVVARAPRVASTRLPVDSIRQRRGAGAVFGGNSVGALLARRLLRASGTLCGWPSPKTFT